MGHLYKQYTSQYAPKCRCEGCKFLDTKLGHVLLEYAIGFISEITQVVKDGKAKPDDELHVLFNGPDGQAARPLDPGRGSKNLAQFNGTVKEIAEMKTLKRIQRPDLDVLREAYQHDPVVLALLEWVQNSDA